MSAKVKLPFNINYTLNFTPRFQGACTEFNPIDLNSNLYFYEEAFARYEALLGEGELLVKPFLMSRLYAGNRVESRLDLSPEQRKSGFLISCSQLLELDETMELPSGYELKDGAKEGKTIESKVASSGGSLKVEGNTLNFRQSLSLNKRVFTAADWQDVRSAVENYRSFDAYLTFQKK